jgi:hypothetical protein
MLARGPKSPDYDPTPPPHAHRLAGVVEQQFNIDVYHGWYGNTVLTSVLPSPCQGKSEVYYEGIPCHWRNIMPRCLQ